MTTVVDTGPLVAAADESGKHHAVCADLLSRLIKERERLIVPVTVMVEVCRLLEKYQGPDAEARFLDLMSSDSVFKLGGLSLEDVERMASLVRQYSGFPLGAIDASVIAIAERDKIQQIATIDRRHFTAVRPAHVSAFKLLP